jgi:hypothetical protein
MCPLICGSAPPSAIRHADVERSAGHHLELGDGVAPDQRCEHEHGSRPGVELAVLDHLVEREVVEQLDQLGIGPSERRLVVWK